VHAAVSITSHSVMRTQNQSTGSHRSAEIQWKHKQSAKFRQKCNKQRQLNWTKGGVLSERWSVRQEGTVTPIYFETAEQHYQGSSSLPRSWKPVPTELETNTLSNSLLETSPAQSETSVNTETQSSCCGTMETIAPEDSASNCFVSFHHSSPSLDRSVSTPTRTCESLNDSHNNDSGSGTETVLHCEPKPRSIVSSVLSLWRGNPVEDFDPTYCLAAYRNTFNILGSKNSNFECDKHTFVQSFKTELGKVLEVHPKSITPKYTQKALQLYTLSKANDLVKLLEPDQRAMEVMEFY